MKPPAHHLPIPPCRYLTFLLVVTILIVVNAVVALNFAPCGPPTHTPWPPGSQKVKLPTPAYFSLFLPCLFTCPTGPGHTPHPPSSATNWPHVYLEAHAQMD